MTILSRRAVLAGGGLTAILPGVSLAQTEAAALTYGISMADIPLTTGQPDRGAGAYQFTGLTLYDPLVAWELDVADRPGKLIPGLATKWETDPADRRRWMFHIRPGVAFHDGSMLDADAVVWNFEKVLNPQAPHFDNRQAAQVRPRLPSVAAWKKLDAMTVEVTTKAVDALFPYQMLWFLISSPAQYAAVGSSWEKFGFAPSGTGPFKLQLLVPRARVDLIRNDAYWNKARLAKSAKLSLVCAPEDLGRTNALLNNQVDLIETPAPDAVSAAEIGRRPHRRQRHAACLELPSVLGRRQPVAGFAHPQGRQSGGRPRRDRRADGRAGQAGGGAGGPSQPLVRQSQLQDHLRPGRGAQADGGGRLQQGQAAEGESSWCRRAAAARCCPCR